MSVERLHLAAGAVPYDSRLAAEHVARYALAAGLCRGRRVLDVACGEGHGSAMLAGAGAAQVVGVDPSAEAVSVAALRFARPGLAFRSGEIAALPDLLADQAPFDLIVSFATIERVARSGRRLQRTSIGTIAIGRGDWRCASMSATSARTGPV